MNIIANKIVKLKNSKNTKKIDTKKKSYDLFFFLFEKSEKIKKLLNVKRPIWMTVNE